jgi:hypothetical protein
MLTWLGAAFLLTAPLPVPLLAPALVVPFLWRVRMPS